MSDLSMSWMKRDSPPPVPAGSRHALETAQGVAFDHVIKNFQSSPGGSSNGCSSTRIQQIGQAYQVGGASSSSSRALGIIAGQQGAEESFSQNIGKDSSIHPLAQGGNENAPASVDRLFLLPSEVAAKVACGHDLEFLCPNATYADLWRPSPVVSWSGTSERLDSALHGSSLLPPAWKQGGLTFSTSTDQPARSVDIPKAQVEEDHEPYRPALSASSTLQEHALQALWTACPNARLLRCEVGMRIAPRQDRLQAGTAAGTTSNELTSDKAPSPPTSARGSSPVGGIDGGIAGLAEALVIPIQGAAHVERATSGEQNQYLGAPEPENGESSILSVFRESAIPRGFDCLYRLPLSTYFEGHAAVRFPSCASGGFLVNFSVDDTVREFLLPKSTGCITTNHTSYSTSTASSGTERATLVLLPAHALALWSLRVRALWPSVNVKMVRKCRDLPKSSLMRTKGLHEGEIEQKSGKVSSSGVDSSNSSADDDDAGELQTPDVVLVAEEVFLSSLYKTWQEQRIKDIEAEKADGVTNPWKYPLRRIGDSESNIKKWTSTSSSGSSSSSSSSKGSATTLPKESSYAPLPLLESRVWNRVIYDRSLEDDECPSRPADFVFHQLRCRSSKLIRATRCMHIPRPASSSTSSSLLGDGSSSTTTPRIEQPAAKDNPDSSGISLRVLAPLALAFGVDLLGPAWKRDPVADVNRALRLRLDSFHQENPSASGGTNHVPNLQVQATPIVCDRSRSYSSVSSGGGSASLTSAVPKFGIAQIQMPVIAKATAKNGVGGPLLFGRRSRNGNRRGGGSGGNQHPPAGHHAQYHAVVKRNDKHPGVLGTPATLASTTVSKAAQLSLAQARNRERKEAEARLRREEAATWLRRVCSCPFVRDNAARFIRSFFLRGRSGTNIDIQAVFSYPSTSSCNVPVEASVSTTMHSMNSKMQSASSTSFRALGHDHELDHTSTLVSSASYMPILGHEAHAHGEQHIVLVEPTASERRVFSVSKQERAKHSSDTRAAQMSAIFRVPGIRAIANSKSAPLLPSGLHSIHAHGGHALAREKCKSLHAELIKTFRLLKCYTRIGCLLELLLAGKQPSTLKRQRDEEMEQEVAESHPSLHHENPSVLSAGGHEVEAQSSSTTGVYASPDGPGLKKLRKLEPHFNTIEHTTTSQREASACSTNATRGAAAAKQSSCLEMESTGVSSSSSSSSSCSNQAGQPTAGVDINSSATPQHGPLSLEDDLLADDDEDTARKAAPAKHPSKEVAAAARGSPLGNQRMACAIPQPSSSSRAEGSCSSTALVCTSGSSSSATSSSTCITSTTTRKPAQGPPPPLPATGAPPSFGKTTSKRTPDSSPSRNSGVLPVPFASGLRSIPSKGSSGQQPRRISLSFSMLELLRSTVQTPAGQICIAAGLELLHGKRDEQDTEKRPDRGSKTSCNAGEDGTNDVNMVGTQCTGASSSSSKLESNKAAFAPEPRPPGEALPRLHPRLPLFARWDEAESLDLGDDLAAFALAQLQRLRANLKAEQASILRDSRAEIRELFPFPDVVSRIAKLANAEQRRALGLPRAGVRKPRRRAPKRKNTAAGVAKAGTVTAMSTTATGGAAGAGKAGAVAKSGQNFEQAVARRLGNNSVHGRNAGPAGASSSTSSRQGPPPQVLAPPPSPGRRALRPRRAARGGAGGTTIRARFVSSAHGRTRRQVVFHSTARGGESGLLLRKRPVRPLVAEEQKVLPEVVLQKHLTAPERTIRSEFQRHDAFFSHLFQELWVLTNGFSRPYIHWMELRPTQQAMKKKNKNRRKNAAQQQANLANGSSASSAGNNTSGTCSNVAALPGGAAPKNGRVIMVNAPPPAQIHQGRRGAPMSTSSSSSVGVYIPSSKAASNSAASPTVGTSSSTTTPFGTSSRAESLLRQFASRVQSVVKALTQDKLRPVAKQLNFFAQMLETALEECECPICMDDVALDEMHITGCGHAFCRSCVDTQIANATGHNAPTCAICRQPLRRTELFPVLAEITFLADRQLATAKGQKKLYEAKKQSSCASSAGDFVGEEDHGLIPHDENVSSSNAIHVEFPDHQNPFPREDITKNRSGPLNSARLGGDDKRVNVDNESGTLLGMFSGKKDVDRTSLDETTLRYVDTRLEPGSHPRIDAIVNDSLGPDAGSKAVALLRCLLRIPTFLELSSLIASTSMASSTTANSLLATAKMCVIVESSADVTRIETVLRHCALRFRVLSEAVTQSKTAPAHVLAQFHRTDATGVDILIADVGADLASMQLAPERQLHAVFPYPIRNEILEQRALTTLRPAHIWRLCLKHTDEVAMIASRLH
ncbi:unnamed protein product [Amoebophrya sp. A25]|nr:unnamed protein product [Amoebophrya sp. A25]|eukprot:GSA25T00016120001.1